MTDGNVNTEKPLDIASWPLRRQVVQVNNQEYRAVRIMAISVGNNINLQNLEKVITPPINQNVFLAADYSDVYNTMRQLAEDSCKYINGKSHELTSKDSRFYCTLPLEGISR